MIDGSLICVLINRNNGDIGFVLSVHDRNSIIQDLVGYFMAWWTLSLVDLTDMMQLPMFAYMHARSVGL